MQTIGLIGGMSWESSAQERSAGDLAALSNLSLATVSEHLKVLRKSGLLRLDRQGRFWMYRSDTKLLARVAKAIGELG